MKDLVKMSIATTCISLFITFIIFLILMPNAWISNIIIHLILCILYGALLKKPELWGLTHIIYFIAILLLASSSFLNPSEIIYGKLAYSYEKNFNLIKKDMIGRNLILEKDGLLIKTKKFKILDGVNRLDLYGEETFKGITGHITFGKPTIKLNKTPNEGSCGPDDYMHHAHYNSSVKNYPECITQCQQDPICNHVKWKLRTDDINDNRAEKCFMMTACPDKLTGNKWKRWKNLSLEKSPTNILDPNPFAGISVGNYIISQNGKYVLLINKKKQIRLYNKPNGNIKERIINLNLNPDKINTNKFKKNILGFGIYKNTIYLWKEREDKKYDYETAWSYTISPSVKIKLILLNRGLLIAYTEDYKILWTNTEVWSEDDISIEQLEKEVKKEENLELIYKYDIKTHKVIKSKTTIDHTGIIKIYDENNKKGKIKLFTSKYNNENYIQFINIGKYSGKYLIK